MSAQLQRVLGLGGHDPAAAPGQQAGRGGRTGEFVVAGGARLLQRLLQGLLVGGNEVSQQLRPLRQLHVAGGRA